MFAPAPVICDISRIICASCSPICSIWSIDFRIMPNPKLRIVSEDAKFMDACAMSIESLPSRYIANEPLH